MKFEYCVITIPINKLVSTQNRLGQEGWELVQVDPLQFIDGEPARIGWYKRELKD